MSNRYNPKEIEEKWRKVWEKEKIFAVNVRRDKKPFYNLMMFPYPSGEGLHVGHVYAFGGSDTYGRLKRLQGYDVFEPMGFDSFGIHSENYAIKVGKHPSELIRETTNYFREKQMKRLGALFDWDHQVITSEPDYYKWTQWLFVQLFKAGLAIRKKSPVDWCPSCKTVLADEQVIAGRCERCKSQVIQKELEQWFFKITDYAERLLANLDRIDWSDSTKQMQRNWIGRSEGVVIKFPVASEQRLEKRKTGNWSQETGNYIDLFTTRPDTVFGATFMVLAPEHPIVALLLSSKFKVQSSKLEEIRNYVEQAKTKSELERSQEKRGVFSGLYCINPFTKKEIPIWIADYVLMGYGTGAIMAVPAHDQRDYEFAKKHNLPIIEVIKSNLHPRCVDTKNGPVGEAYEGEGVLINSWEFNRLDSETAREKITEYVEKDKIGKKTINYHLRDWLISRQRYWGPPIPMIFCQSCAKEGKSWFTSREAERYRVSSMKYAVSKNKKIPNTEYDIQNTDAMRGWYPVPEDDLPVELPYLEDYQPRGKGLSPLAQEPSFANVACPQCRSAARRETDVSDTFLDSSWYFLRYPSVGMPNEKSKKFDIGHLSLELPWNPEITRRWLPVDMYIGGNEHAVMHLLYTRFITMALHDMGFTHFEEPFKKFRAHGLIIRDGAKMSKSRGNVVNPNEYMDAYGTDTLRMYLLFIGPYDLGGDFSDRAIAGVHRFLNRLWQNSLEISKNPAESASKDVQKAINKLVKKVGEDVENLKFNTAIAAIMEFNNLISKHKEEVDKETLRKYFILLSIFAPYTAEELWSGLGEKGSVHGQGWPQVEEKWLEEEEVTIAVQVNGKLRDTVRVQTSEFREQKKVEQLAFESERIKKHLSSNKIKKTIYVPGKVLNIVTKGYKPPKRPLAS